MFYLCPHLYLSCFCNWMLYFLCALSLRKYTNWLFVDWDRWSDYAAAPGLYLAPPPVTGADDHHREVLESQRPPLWLTDPLSGGRIVLFLKSQISSSCCHLLVLQFVCLRRRLNDYFFNPILFLLDSLIKHSIYLLYGFPLTVGHLSFQLCRLCRHWCFWGFYCAVYSLYKKVFIKPAALTPECLTAALRCNKADDSSLVWEEANIMKTPLVTKWHQTWCCWFHNFSTPARKYKQIK